MKRDASAAVSESETALQRPAGSWGGKRAGAGRRPTGVRQLGVTVSATDREILERLGDGNISAGVRRLIAERANPVERAS